MTHLLVTNPCIRYLNGQSPRLRERIDAAGPELLAVCSIVKAELHFGALKSQAQVRTLSLQQHFLSRFKSLPFDDAAASAYGRIRSELERRGTPNGANDLMIAAIAITNRLTLVTHNVGEFSRIADLQVEDWEAE